MAHYIDKDALVAEIESLRRTTFTNFDDGVNATVQILLETLDTLEVKEVDLKKELRDFVVGDIDDYDMGLAKHFYELGLKVQHDNWKVVDNINLPQADRNKIYCVLSKGKYLLAKVINHPHDELLQWCCTEFPFHCYDMCEGDKYMQIV